MSAQILNPMGRTVVQQHPLAPRAGTLEGATVGLLDTRKRNGEILLAEIGALLMQRYGVKQLVTRQKELFSVPASAALIDELAAECNYAIIAIGD